MPRTRALAGKRFYFLVVIERAGTDSYGNATWLCQCDCGKRLTISSCALQPKERCRKSCGCKTRQIKAEFCKKHCTKHGLSYGNEYTLWRCAKRRAAKKRVPFLIKVTDIHIPEYCPVLGIKLVKHSGSPGPKPNSPSLDRLIPEKGYVPGNVSVISHKANVIKQNATPEEIMRVSRWLETELAKGDDWDLGVASSG